MRIMIVDDDELALEALTYSLGQAGYETLVAHDGREALDILQRGGCRMVVSDWVMPGMDGLELCRRIRLADFGGYIYFLLLTSRDDKGDIIAGLSAGADDFLTKPFHAGEPRARIRTGERVLALETREVAIFAMARLVESRDPETGEHLERMREYCRILAAHLASHNRSQHVIDDEYVRLIYLTSPLHDIGKVGIPDSVLLKPGRLSDREFEIMKTHTTIGAETLDAAAREYPGVRYLALAKNIALTHHERYNGQGYPTGLVGEEIPLCGRLVALADVYDALTSKRVYKSALEHEIARDMILEESGKHFDPVVVEAFIQEEEQFIQVQHQSTHKIMVPA